MFKKSVLFILIPAVLGLMVLSCEDPITDDVAPAEEAVSLGGGGFSGEKIGDAIGPVTIPNSNLEEKLKKSGYTDVSDMSGFQINVDVYTGVNESRNGQGTRIVFAAAGSNFSIGRTNGAGDNGDAEEAFVYEGVVYAVGTRFRNGDRTRWTPSFKNPGIWTVNTLTLPNCIGNEFKEDRFPALQYSGYGTSLDVRGGKIVAVRHSMDILPKGWTIVGRDQGGAARSTRIRLSILDDSGNQIPWTGRNGDKKSKVVYQLETSKTYCDTYLNRFHPNGGYDFTSDEVAKLNEAGASKIKVEFFVYYQNPLNGVIPSQGTVPNRAVGPDGNIEVKTIDINERLFK